MDRNYLYIVLIRMYKTQAKHKQGIKCPVCDEVLGKSTDIHEFIVKRNAVPKDKQDLIFVPQNCVLIHRGCHENSREVDLKCLDYVLTRISAAEIAWWYRKLADQLQGLPRGNTITYRNGEWELYVRSLL